MDWEHEGEGYLNDPKIVYLMGKDRKNALNFAKTHFLQWEGTNRFFQYSHAHENTLQQVQIIIKSYHLNNLKYNTSLIITPEIEQHPEFNKIMEIIHAKKLALTIL